MMYTLYKSAWCLCEKMDQETILADTDSVVRRLFNKPRQEMNIPWILGLTVQIERMTFKTSLVDKI